MTLPDIPSKMGAVVLTGRGASPTYGTLPVPRPGRGQVLVRMAAAPINPSDLGFVSGSYGYGSAFPVVPGFEGSGTVVAAGGGALPRLLLGRRVACASSAAVGGSWAEYMVTSARSCLPLPRRLSFERGSTAFVNPFTALAFMEEIRRGGHRAVVNTAAGSALAGMVRRLCRRRGIPVIDIVRRPSQAATLRGTGARHVLLRDAPDFRASLEELARALCATLALDAVGGPGAGELLEALPPGSTLISYGFLSGAPTTFDARALASTGKTVTGFFLGDWVARTPGWRTLLAGGRVRRLLDGDLSSSIRCTMPLSSIGRAMELYTQDMSAGKVLLVPG